MFSVQGYARLDAMFVAFRAERLASAEQELDGCNGQLPSEDDIEQEFLIKVSQSLSPDLISFDQARLSCYDDNEVRPDNYYHDKANCDCPLCILDGREC